MWQFVQQNALLCGTAVVGSLGVVSQIILRMVYDGMIRDMKNPGTPKGRYMKQLKQKYNIYRRTQNGSDSIQIFIQKSLMDFRFWHLQLHTWRRLGGIAMILCLMLGTGGWYQKGMGPVFAGSFNRELLVMASSVLLILGAYGVTDTGYRKKYLETGLRSAFTNQMTQSAQEVDLSDKGDGEKTKAQQEVAAALSTPRKKKGKIVESQAQRDKRELKENLAKLKEGIHETAAETERSRERNTEILKQMDPAEQERIIRGVLKEFLS